MKRCKKILAVFLAVIIACSSFAITSFAADPETSSSFSSFDFVGTIKAYFESISKLFRKIFNAIKGLFGIESPEIIEDFLVSSANETQGQSSAIKVQCEDFEYSLYLPANMRKEALVFTFNDGSKASINGTEIQSGEVSSVLSDLNKCTLVLDGEKYSISIYQSENIPAVYISTESGTMDSVHADKEYKEPGSIAVVNADGTVEYDGGLDYIKGRGNSSWKYVKKGYNIKLDKSTDLCDMGKTKKWSLIPNHIDKSLLRNQMVYDLADAVGLDYSPANQSVDLYLNGQYNGTYLLVVKNEIDSASIDIDNLEKATEKVNDAELDTYSKNSISNQNGVKHYKYIEIPNNPEDITGGYYLELDHSSYGKEASGFTTMKGQRIVIKSPEYASKAQVEYISAWFQEFEDAVYSEDGYNALHKHYTEYIDMESFAKYYMMTEITMNGDSHITSVFMYKESDDTGDGLLHAGPVWDYDSSLGNNGGVKHFDVDVTLTNPKQQFYSISKIYQTNTDYIYAALYKHSDFRKAAADYYKSDIVPALNVLLSKSDKTMGRLRNFDSYVEEITPSATMNFKRYNIMTNAMTGTQTGVTYVQNVNQLYSFIKNKKAFLDQIIDAYYEDYLYIFVDGSSIYGVTSFEDKTVELFKGNQSTLNTVITHGGVDFTVTTKK